MPTLANADETLLRLPSGGSVQFSVDAPSTIDAKRIIAIIVPGTGVNDRHGGPHKVYDALTKALNENGLYVARFEPKFTATDNPSGPGGATEVSIATQKIILIELVRLLRGPEFNFSKIVFIGHSQGSFVAAQVMSKYPLIVDGFFSYGMSIRPLRQATEYGVQALPLAMLKNIVDSGADDCVPNDLVREQVIARGLLGISGPVEYWLSPQGQWCKNDLRKFVPATVNNLRAFLTLTNECVQGREKLSVNTKNSCEQLLFFRTTESLQSLLEHVTVPVGIAMGKNDPLLDLPAELSAYVKRTNSNKDRTWRFLVVNGVGHWFGRNLIDGPAEPAALAEFSRFVRSTLTCH